GVHQPRAGEPLRRVPLPEKVYRPGTMLPGTRGNRLLSAGDRTAGANLLSPRLQNVVTTRTVHHVSNPPRDLLPSREINGSTAGRGILRRGSQLHRATAGAGNAPRMPHLHGHEARDANVPGRGSVLHDAARVRDALPRRGANVLSPRRAGI